MNDETVLLLLGGVTHFAVLALILGSAFGDVPLDWQALLFLGGLEVALLRLDPSSVVSVLTGSTPSNAQTQNQDRDRRD